MHTRYVGVGVLIGAACILAGCEKSPLYTNLSELQANEVQAALLSARIDAQKEAEWGGRNPRPTEPGES